VELKDEKEENPIFRNKKKIQSKYIFLLHLHILNHLMLHLNVEN